MTRLRAVFSPIAAWLAGFSIALAQIVADPYKRSGPADEEREFIASHIGQPNAPETVATLKEIYAAAAKFYATDADGHLFLRYTAAGADSGSGITGVPLTWTTFGNGLKIGQIILIRLTSAPPPTPLPASSPATSAPSASQPAPSPPPTPPTAAPTDQKPEIIEYTVRWLPQQAAPPPSSDSTPSPNTDDSMPMIPISDPANHAASHDYIRKIADDIQSFVLIAQSDDKSFLTAHSGFQSDLVALNNAAKAVSSSNSDATPALVNALASSLDAAIQRAAIIAKRPIATAGNSPGNGRSESAESNAKIQTYGSQLNALKTSLLDAIAGKSPPPTP